MDLPMPEGMQNEEIVAAALEPLPPVPPLPGQFIGSMPPVSLSQVHVSQAGSQTRTSSGSSSRSRQTQVPVTVAKGSDDDMPHEALTREDVLAAGNVGIAAPIVSVAVSAGSGRQREQTATPVREQQRAQSSLETPLPSAPPAFPARAPAAQKKLAALGSAAADHRSVAAAPAPASPGGASSVVAAAPAARAKPKGWDQCLQFARFVRSKSASGVELVRVWKSTCEPAVRSGRASERYRLMCNSLGGAVEPFSHQADYSVEELCDAVLSVFHDITAADVAA